MTRFRKPFAAVLLACFTLLQARAEEPAPPAAAPIADAPFLWEVQGPKTRHYLLGSVHVLPPSARPLPQALDAAYAATRVLMVETDLDELATPELQNLMLGAAREERPGGLQARIGKALYARLQKRAASLGMPTPVCDAFRAWFCALALELYPLQQANFSMEYGIDQHYFALAREDARPIVFLETPQAQLNLFTQMPEAMSKQMLAATLDESTYDSQSPEELNRIWRAGDFASMEKVVKDMRTKFPALYERLVAERNRNWLTVLVEQLRSDTPALVVVGAAHFAGPEGLTALLKARGLEVRPASLPIAPATPASPE
jgi:uncharacterized protein YbaP (TraB family)